jgi:hypothetical protein
MQIDAALPRPLTPDKGKIGLFLAALIVCGVFLRICCPRPA